MVGGGPFRLKAGQWTDDTSMALRLAESLLDRGELDLEDQLRRYVMWHESGYLSSNGRCFDIGITTRTQLGSHAALVAQGGRYAAMVDTWDQHGEDSASEE